VAVIPVELRPALAHELDRLVRGELVTLMECVTNYGSQGAVLVPQPETIWEHPFADAVQTHDGGWHVVLPLFTAAESPSDLSAELIIDPSGIATLHDVHVL
jgi:hypothetical protein